MIFFKRTPKMIACFIATLLLIWISPAFGEQIELNLASWSSPKHFSSTAIINWIKEVEEKSGGRLKINHYPGGQLYGTKDMHKAVAKGMVDIGQALQPSMMAMVPIFQGLYLPFMYDSVDEAAKAYEGESGRILAKGLAKKNLKLIFPIFGDGVQIFSNQKNLDTMDDLKGMRILTTSNIFAKILKRAGAAPDTSIPFTEQYMALKRRVADANTTSITSGFLRKNYEVCPYVTQLNMSFPTVPVIINLKKWKSLPEDIQQIMLNAGKKQYHYCLSVAKKWEEKFTKATISKGSTITQFPDEERAKIVEISRFIWSEWAEETSKDAVRLIELNQK